MKLVVRHQWSFSDHADFSVSSQEEGVELIRERTRNYPGTAGEYQLLKLVRKNKTGELKVTRLA